MLSSRWRRGMVTATAVTTSLAALAIGPALADGTGASDKPSIKVEDGRTQAAFSYRDAIREHIMVQLTVDSDRDGKLDRAGVDVIRPKETDQGLKVPSIIESSPYNDTVGRGFEAEKKSWDAAGNPVTFPMHYDNYFVPRGYAIVQVDTTGTATSDGCFTVGGDSDVAASKAAVDWLNGRVKGYRADGSEAKADWSTGKSGMIGKSFDGTLANAVAGTGVDGLETIVPISAVSSWYDITRSNGAKHWEGFSQYLSTALDTDPDAKCQAVREDLAAGEDDATGNYNAYWHERNYVAKPAPEIGHVTASVLAVHTLNDQNVRPNQFSRWWDGLKQQGVPRKLWLGQYGHTDAFDFPGRRDLWQDTLHQWLDYWLHGVKNGIMDEPRVDLQTGPTRWTTQSDWPARTSSVPLYPGANGSLGLRPAPSGAQSFTDLKVSEADLITDPTTTKPGRLAYVSQPLTSAARLSGTPAVDIKLTLDKPTSNLTAMLVDYGEDERIDVTRNEPQNDLHDGVQLVAEESCHGESTAEDDACYRKVVNVTARNAVHVIARGSMDAQNHTSLSHPRPLTPGQSYQIRWQTLPNDYEIKPGHRIGLVLAGTPAEYLYFETATGAKATVDLPGSKISIPVVGSTLTGANFAPAERASKPWRGPSTAPRPPRPTLPH
ncbi:CocE/NonD family hydrolase [Streptomyces zagrosensis]|uniref:X-Pro dipeptidyl-peptidase n=1 Tax=Streptomyces zagrosensis TaxID=1042984 RepID=A0A7W9V094_9ACTN|nr:CocE/NonD family hydrolase [Streptomyces zagrosensis]MBB5936569.1 X-Pro dipeptidyl-peptidase [Streptomyces zagrosensis]